MLNLSNCRSGAGAWLAALLGVIPVKADLIGVNFVGGSTVNGMPADMGPAETAGLVPLR